MRVSELDRYGPAGWTGTVEGFERQYTARFGGGLPFPPPPLASSSPSLGPFPPSSSRPRRYSSVTHSGSRTLATPILSGTITGGSCQCTTLSMVSIFFNLVPAPTAPHPPVPSNPTAASFLTTLPLSRINPRDSRSFALPESLKSANSSRRTSNADLPTHRPLTEDWRTRTTGGGQRSDVDGSRCVEGGCDNLSAVISAMSLLRRRTLDGR
mmetsp:Transcript_33619/g.100238  ORF Transcript_33619/g.100238 Transcript_33619/m.100238 type:complete len:211 (+) Transcript_33619:1281-1913(+)